MFTVTEEHLLIGLTLTFIVICFYLFKRVVKALASLKRMKTLIKEGEERVRKLKESGDHHDWMQVTIGDKAVHVCKKTGYCPDPEGYISMVEIERHLEKLKLQEQYKQFTMEKIAEIATDMQISTSQVEEIATRIISIKQEFQIKLINDSFEGVMKVFEEVKNEQTKH